MTRMLLLSLSGLALIAGVLGFTAGWQVRGLTETDVIEALAAQYVAEVPGAQASDCAAWPGQEPAWLVVACGAGTAARVWEVDRLGRLLSVERGGVPDT